MRLSPALRRFALALLLARVATFAVAPLFERTPVERPGASVSSDRPASPTGFVHDAASCPACVLLQGHTSPVVAHAALAPSVAAGPVVARALRAPDRTAPRAGFLSRAPPVAIA